MNYVLVVSVCSMSWVSFCRVCRKWVEEHVPRRLNAKHENPEPYKVL